MSRRQRTVFTALPNGLVPGPPGKYRLSVHIAPQLRNDTDTVLSTFPDWATWPATVNAIGWSVAFGAAPPVAATVESAPAQASLWSSLFAGGALVRSHNPPTELKDRPVRSFPARNVMAFLQKHYTDFAVASPEELPHIDDLMHPFAFGFLPIETLKEGIVEFDVGGVGVESVLSAEKVYTNGPALTKHISDFYQIHRFHQPRTKLDQSAETLPPVVLPTLDFHQVVSSAGQFPPLLRHLGLVVDLVVDLGGTLPATPNEVRIVPNWTPTPPDGPGSAADIATPRTRCLIDGGQFRARPRAADPELVDGRLPMNDTDRFTLLQVDQDGAALKLIDFAGNLARFLTGRSVATPDRYAVPSLRSGGLSVARINRAVEFHQRVGRGADAANALGAETPGDVVLDAEDVTRGHRIDIRDTREGKWFSLAARTGTYQFPGGVNVPFADEGWTTAAVTEDDTPQQSLYLQESLFRWGGWSLAVPRPGGRLATTQDQDPPVTTAPVETDPNFPVTVNMAATPGTLPRLRFGRNYEVRARAVDLAGNGDPLDPLVEDRRKTPPVDYLRFQPVQSPPVLLHSPRTEGESLERVVLRSNYNLPPRVEFSARHLVPPKADQVLAEQHGLFDTEFPNSVVRAAAYETIAPYATPAPPDPNAPVVQAEQGSFATSSERRRDQDDHAKTFYYPVDVVTLPYLPDPMAAGAALVFRDHPALEPNQLVQVPFNSEAWPAHKPIRLVVREGDGAPSYDAATHQLLVPLGKADVVHVKLSAFPPRDRIDELGIWNWIKGRGANHLLQTVADGRHWMVTPNRLLTLVHAVRQPLTLAEFTKLGSVTNLTVAKKPGETFVTFDGSITFSRKSTSRIDVVASWDEYVDQGPGKPDPTDPTATPPIPPAAVRTVAFSVPRDRAGASIPDLALLGPPAPDRQEFSDTRHRQVGYTTIATTRFGEYFVETEDVVVNFGAGTAMLVTLSTGTKGFVPGSVKVKNKPVVSPDGKVTDVANYVEWTHYSVDYGKGEVTLLKGGAGFPAQGRTVTVAYLVPPIVRPGPGETMEPVVRSIKSSALPAAPKVVYIVPTFGWETVRFFTAIESRRRGLGLRVYLERPWWSSGEGELLGVILNHPDAPNPVNLAREAALTRLGVDPVFKSTDTLPPLNLFSFPLAKTAGIGPNGKGLTLPGTEGVVLVSGHAVGFDRRRDLWYCDIQVNAASYFPFIKLGLCRFQPESLDGMHLSPAVTTEFCQLAPDRTATLTIPFAGPPGARDVRVVGQSYERAGRTSTPPLMRVSVERLDPNQGTDLGWSPVGKTTDLTRQPNVGTDSVWSGQVVVPGAPPGTKQRLVIEEFERHLVGDGAVTGDRIVHSDIIEL